MSKYGLIMSSYGCIMSNYGFSDNIKLIQDTTKKLFLDHRRFNIHIKTVLFGFNLHAGGLLI